MDKNFPNLKIIPSKSAVLHEYTDPDRVRKLRQRIAKGGFMQNPILVSKLRRGRYLVLDGANRVTVFQELGVPHILAQIVEYKKPWVELLRWNHLVCDKRFKKYCKDPVVRFEASQHEAMNEFVNLYKGRFKFYRVVEENFKLLSKQYKNASCLVIFPKFQPKDLVGFALNNHKIPTGISRHLINGRALRLRIPLNFLRQKKSLTAKNRWLAKHITGIIKNNQVRYYAEPVYIFDE